jgi:hypothetical protein
MSVTKFERIAPRDRGVDELLLIKETLEKVANGNMSASLEAKIDMLIVALERLAERPAQAPTEPAIDIPELVAKVYETTNVKPNYQFKIERNQSGQLVGITATQEGR